MIDNFDIEDAYEKLERIKTRNDINVDEEVLFAALSLYTWAGMKKKEIASAKIQDIVYNPDNIIGININRDNNADFIRLFEHPRQVLIQYWQYLGNSPNYGTTSDSLLFSVYDGESGERKLTRHLKKLGENNEGLSCSNEWKLSYLREVGMVDYYNNLKENGCSEEQALHRTAEQFRMSEKQADKRIKGVRDRVPPNNYDKFLDHCFQTETLDFTNDRKVKNHEEKGLRLIDKIKCSSDDKESYRRALQTVLSKGKENFLKRQSEKTDPTQRLSQQEAIRRYLDESTSTENSSPTYFDLDKRFSKEDGNDNDDQEKSDEDDQENPDKN